MKKQVIGFMLLLSLAFPVFSEQAPANHHALSVGQKVELLTQELGLSDEQKAKVEALLTEQNAKWEALKAEKQQAYTEILTLEQLSKLEQLHKKHGNKAYPHS